jgi:zinc/manganese transport system substrate-binding protein
MRSVRESEKDTGAPLAPGVWRTALAVGVAALTAWTCEASAKVRVVATTSDVSAVIAQVGGDRVEITTLAKGYMDPHYLEAKPSYVAKMRRADILAYNGLQLEIGWLPLILQGARNSKIVVGATGHLQMSRGLEILEVPAGALSREMGDIHPEGNPHYTLDPRNLLAMAATTAAVLSSIDPSGAEEFAENRAAFARELEPAIRRWEDLMQPYRGGEIVCYHKQWEYLLHWLDIEPVAYVEHKPGIPPAPRHLEQLERLLRERRIPVLLSSTFVSTDHLERRLEGTGTRLLVLPAAVGGEDHIETPVAYFDYIVESMARAFREAESP